jgi:pSer/pThr/pTyr-binding forkhead associated (FHA) protein
MMAAAHHPGFGPEVDVPEGEAPVGTVVVVRKSGRDGGRFPLAKGTATIGRLETCDIRIALPYVSRKHAELRVEDGKVRVCVCVRSRE